MSSRHRTVAVLAFLPLMVGSLSEAIDQPPPLSAELSLRSIEVHSGFKVELVAAEPIVADPIALDWGTDGKLWVCEMHDYPLGLDGKGEPGGRIVSVEDTDGDGRYDTRTVFLEKLPFPSAVKVWRDGVLVGAAPDIFFAQDTTGDGKADLRRTLYRGMGTGAACFHVNSLRWGLDNWVYGSSGFAGGKVRSTTTGDVLDVGRADFRIRPDWGLIDRQDGPSQYGRYRDAWGNWFGTANSDPVWHFALADHYTRRNPHVPFPDGKIPVPVIRGNARVYPSSKTLARFNFPEQANHITSACGSAIYDDRLFGSEFEGNTFVCEPVHNLIHREVMTPRASTFSSRRAPEELESEFLRSRDNWFRPVWLEVGPDSALWVVDMYRLVIEHPNWIPEKTQKELNLRAGDDRGRIYRVYPKDRALRAIPRLEHLSTAELVVALDSPCRWQRDTVQQMLVWRKDLSAVPALTRMAAVAGYPGSRLQALCTLSGLGALDVDTVARALADPHAGVRRHAVRLSEPFLARSRPILESLLELVGDADPQVRMQLAYTLGESDTAAAGRALGQLALQNMADPLLIAAIISSATRRPNDIMDVVLSASLDTVEAESFIAQLVRIVVAFDDSELIGEMLVHIVTPRDGSYSGWQIAAFAQLVESLESSERSLEALAASGGEELGSAVAGVPAMYEAAHSLALDTGAATGLRLAAVKLLGGASDGPTRQVEVLAQLLTPKSAARLQEAAIDSLGRIRHDSAALTLLQKWKTYSPAQRTRVLDVLIRREASIHALLDAVEEEEITPLDVGATVQEYLSAHRSEAIRRRARELLNVSVDKDRQRVIDGYLPAVKEAQGDVERGIALFLEHCASCHHIGERGQRVGPDLVALTDRSAEFMVTAILDPNRSVWDEYVNFTAMTRRADVHTGLLTRESDHSITILSISGQENTLLRADLLLLEGTNRSMMPDGFEQFLKPRDIADLMSFLNASTPPPRKVDGNQPELVRPDDQGRLRLLATRAEIYGDTLTYSPKHDTLRRWHTEKNHAVWSVSVETAGAYDVFIHWTLPEEHAGQEFILSAGGNRLVGTTGATGSWESFRQARVGRLRLEAGPQRLLFRSRGAVRGSFILLRELTLVPAAVGGNR